MKDDILLEIMNLSLVTGGGWIRELQTTFPRGNLSLLVSDEPRKITSLMHILKGLGTPKEGHVIYHGDGVGLVLNSDQLPDWSNPDQELSLYSTLTGVRRGDLNDAMVAWDVAGISKLPIRHLNAYEKKALFLALETASNPDLLLCEEPLEGLNPGQTWRMLSHLAHYAKNHLVLIGTVNPGLFPEEIPRVYLDRQKARSWEESYTLWLSDQNSTSILAEGLVVGRSGEGSNSPAMSTVEDKTTSDINPDSAFPDLMSASEDDRRPITVHVRLPVGESTDYELRRIGEIKFFEPSADGNGYHLDLLKKDQVQLKDLLASRGLILDEQEDER